MLHDLGAQPWLDDLTAVLGAAVAVGMLATLGKLYANRAPYWAFVVLGVGNALFLAAWGWMQFGSTEGAGKAFVVFALYAPFWAASYFKWSRRPFMPRPKKRLRSRLFPG